MRYAYFIAAALLLSALPQKADAFWMTADARASTELHLRTGPATSYRVLDAIGKGERVSVVGCLKGWQWCDVKVDGKRGWVHAKYLKGMTHGKTYSVVKEGRRHGIREISFNERSYWSRHYHGKDFCQKRYGTQREAMYDRPEQWDRGSEPAKKRAAHEKQSKPQKMSALDVRYSNDLRYND